MPCVIIALFWPLFVVYTEICKKIREERVTKMGLKLYHTKLSPPVRSILMLADILKLDIELIEINLLEKEHLSPGYLEMNPQHTVPTLKDGDFILWDSHAISIYLVEKYAKNDDLYPNDTCIKAGVNRCLYFDAGVLFPTLKNIYFSLIFLKQKRVPKERVDALEEAYSFMDKFLREKRFLVGENLTIADICCVATLSCGQILYEIQPEKHPWLYNWFQRCEAKEWYQNGNQPGLEILKTFTKGVTLEL